MPALFGAETPTRMNPACAMLEYASIRLTSVCAIAIRLPAAIVSAASVQTTGCQFQVSGWNDTSSTRISAANAATFVAADMNAVTAGGAPRQTSGVPMWNGTAAILNAKPIASSAAATSTSAEGSTRPESAVAMPVILVVPVVP